MGARASAKMLSAVSALGFAFLVVTPSAPALERKLTAADAATANRLGTSVAIDGDTAVVGAPGAGSSQGAVYVYARTGDAWAQAAKLTASDGANGDGLGTSVAIDGDTIVAGAVGDTIAGATGHGSAYTFARTGAANRTETGKLIASDGLAGDAAGQAVAIDGDTIVVGAPGDDLPGAASCEGHGSVYTFARTGDPTRTQTAKLTAADAVNTGFCFAGGGLGSSVAIDGDTIVGGARSDRAGSPANPAFGAVYTFDRTGATTRVSTAKLTVSPQPSEGQLGASVGIEGGSIVAGDPHADSHEGAVYTFSRTGAAARNQTAELTASFGADDDQLGNSVAISGSSIVAGAVGRDGGGMAYRFASTGGNRTETWFVAASDRVTSATFGTSVATDDDRLLVGDPDNDAGSASSDRGAAYVMTPTIEVFRTGTGSGSVSSSPAGIACPASCFASYDIGTQVTLTPTPNPGSFFAGWSGEGCSGTDSCTITVDGNEAPVATFTLGTAPVQRALTVTKSGTGQGTVTSSPPGINCGSDCTEAYDENTSVTLTATAAAGSEFAGWSGSGCPQTGTCTVTMDAAKSVSAAFDATPTAPPPSEPPPPPATDPPPPTDPPPADPGPADPDFAVDLETKAKQTAEKLSATATCTLDCLLTLRAAGKADGDKFSSKATTVQLTGGLATKLEVKLKAKVLKAIADAAGKVTFSATATEADSGEIADDTVKSKLKP